MTAIQTLDLTVPIDAQTAYDLLAAAVELAGADHVYTAPGGRMGACKYTDPDSDNPGCLVGTALAIHGVPIAEMRVWDKLGASIELVAVRYRPAFLPTVDGTFDSVPDTIAVLSAAQNVQDAAAAGHAPEEDGHVDTWGDALAAAAAKLAELTADADA